MANEPIVKFAAIDPPDESFSLSLYVPGEEGLIHPTHTAVRRHVAIGRRTASGRFWLQCACCAHLPRGERARCSIVAPQSLKSLYRAFVRFMMYHVPACEHVPDEIRALPDPANAGTKRHWPELARGLGLEDGEWGIVYVGTPEAWRPTDLAARTLSRSASLTAAIDPIDESFSLSLYVPGEEGLIDPAHTAVRRRVAIGRRTASGRFWLQCACCAHLPRGERARCSVVVPHSLKGLFRAFVRFMMNHVPACKHVPDEIRALPDPANAKTKHHWPELAREVGLEDGEWGIVHVGTSEQSEHHPSISSRL